MNMEIDTGSTSSDRTAADAILIRLRQAGVRYLFANAGPDFASIVESMASDESGSMVAPVLVPHEAVAVAMAHGYTMVTGEPQAVMVHVSVGTANALCAVINASRLEIPMIFMAGRTPITEDRTAAEGARTVYVHWAQEMYDQGAMVREMVKWDYELRAPDEGVHDRSRVAIYAPGLAELTSFRRNELFAAFECHPEVIRGMRERALAHYARPTLCCSSLRTRPIDRSLTSLKCV